MSCGLSVRAWQCGGHERQTQVMRPKVVLVSVELIRSLVTKQDPGRGVREGVRRNWPDTK